MSELIFVPITADLSTISDSANLTIRTATLQQLPEFMSANGTPVYVVREVFISNMMPSGDDLGLELFQVPDNAEPGWIYNKEENLCLDVPSAYARWASYDYKLARLRDMRNRALYFTDYITIRHRDEQDIGGSTTLTAEEYQSVLMYRKSLRDSLSEVNAENIDQIELPQPPTCLLPTSSPPV